MSSAKSERRNITQPADWWAAFEAQAKAEGASLSKWIGMKCIESLPEEVKTSLIGRPAAHRPRKPKLDW